MPSSRSSGGGPGFGGASGTSRGGANFGGGGRGRSGAGRRQGGPGVGGGRSGGGERGPFARTGVRPHQINQAAAAAAPAPAATTPAPPFVPPVAQLPDPVAQPIFGNPNALPSAQHNIFQQFPQLLQLFAGAGAGGANPLFAAGNVSPFAPPGGGGVTAPQLPNPFGGV